MHPFASQAKSSSSTKFKALTGKKSGGAVHSDEAQDRRLITKMMKEHKAEGGRVPGKAAGGRLDKHARGGVVKKNFGGAMGAGMMPGAVPPVVPGAIPPQAMGALPPQAMMGGARPYKSGGAVKKAEGGEIKPLEPAKGSIERLGVNTFRRELGRDPVSKKFGKSEYPKTYKRGGRTGSKVNINIVSVPKKDPASPLPAAMPGPLGMAAAGPPPVAGGGPPPKPPGMMARGGRASGGKVDAPRAALEGLRDAKVLKPGQFEEEAAKLKPKARGGAVHTGGDNGVGRLEKAAVAKRRQ